MPEIRVPSTYEAAVTFTVASPRPEGVPSHIIPNGKLHNEIASVLRGALREYKHLNRNADFVPVAQQVVTYLPRIGGDPFYLPQTINSAGSIIEVNEPYFLDILRLRYAIVFTVQNAAYLAEEGEAEAYEEHWLAAFKQLLTQGYQLGGVWIPGEEGDRDDTKTSIDVLFEMGAEMASRPFHKSPG